MTTHSEHAPATVPLAQQAGDARSRWSWAEPCAWTVRILATLEPARPDEAPRTDVHRRSFEALPPCRINRRGGVKGDKWFGLYDKMFSERNLLAAF